MWCDLYVLHTYVHTYIYLGTCVCCAVVCVVLSNIWKNAHQYYRAEYIVGMSLSTDGGGGHTHGTHEHTRVRTY